MKNLVFVILATLVLLIAWLLFNTFTFESRQITADPIEVIDISDSTKHRLSKAISIPTISNASPAAFDSSSFEQFKRFVKYSYPLVDSLLEVTYINTYSMIFKWEGTNRDLDPMILMGHHDVVPVPKENIGKWTEPPFSGAIKDDVIWGRGAIDDKISVIGNLEAVEHLLTEGFQPIRSVYLCFGHDEELGGDEGAIAIVSHLRSNGIQAEFVLDEGFAISQGLVPGIEADVAMIGTAEKGFVTFNLSIELEGGHSSMPNKESAIDVLSRAIVKLKDNPFEARMTDPIDGFMDYLGPEMPFFQKMAFANRAIFKPIIIGIYEGSPSGNALMRTTTAPTIINAGIKDNIIPYEAKATINFRTLPGTTIEDVRNHVEKIIDDDRIILTAGDFNSEAPQASSTDSFGYKAIEKTIKQLYPEVLIAPNLVIGATDSRHYYPLSQNIYRFAPFYLNEENMGTFHGINERIKVVDFEQAVRFYIQLIKNSSMAESIN